MRKIFIPIVLALFLFACKKEKLNGSGNIITEQRQVTGFTAVNVSGANNVFIEQGNDLTVSVKGYANLVSHFETKLSGSTLLLSYPENTSVKNDNIEIHITMPLITGLSLSGSSNISATGVYADVPALTTTISGSGNISIEQMNASKYTASISGSGNINTAGVTAVDAITRISGSGNIKLSASKTLDADISGSGNVYYTGDAQVDSKTSGSGKVIKQ